MAGAAAAMKAPTEQTVVAIKKVVRSLKPVVRTPTSTQYKDYRSQSRTKQTPSPYFKPRFTFAAEDREKTFGHALFKQAGVDDPLMPAYPYGKNVTFKEANFGLYGGATIQSGSKISKGRNKGKSLRHWFPNVRIEDIRSESLDMELRIPVTARVMRTIKKCGGLDQYVTGPKPARVKELGLLGWRLRWLVMTSPKMQEAYAKEREKYGLKGKSPMMESFEDVWNDKTRQYELIQQQEADWQRLKEAAERFERHTRTQWKENGEKGPYRIPKLKTLQDSSPLQLGYPSTLPEYAEEEVTLPSPQAS